MLGHFVKLYSEDEDEANLLLGTLYNRHIDYLQMIGYNTTTDLMTGTFFQKVPEYSENKLEEIEEKIEE